MRKSNATGNYPTPPPLPPFIPLLEKVMFRFLNFTKRKWLIHLLHTGLQCLICWLTAANPPPICFGIPHVKAAKACVKLAKISIKKGHTGACAALEFKTFHATKGIPLGCFFFRGDDGLDIGTFLDTESLMLLMGHLLQDAVVCFSWYDSFELFLTRKTKESQILSWVSTYFHKSEVCFSCLHLNETSFYILKVYAR